MKIVKNYTTVPTPALLAIYNELADRPIKKFRDSSSAALRTERLVEQSGMAVAKVGEEYRVVSNTDTEPKSRGGYPGTSTVAALVASNPKRAGTLAHARFQLLLEKPMTVEAYAAACAAMQPESGRRNALGDLRWGVEHGQLEVK